MKIAHADFNHYLLKYKPEIDKIQQIIGEIASSSVKEVDEVFKYILSLSGKMLRPFLTLLVSDATHGISKNTLIGAAVVEIIHISSLLHDDVIDQASIRRKKPTVRNKWGEKISILTGDSLLSKGINLLVKNKLYEILHILSHTFNEMTEGQILEQHIAQNPIKALSLTYDEYITILKKKTAVLFGAAMLVGYISSQNNPSTLIKEKIWQSGLNFGIAFQITDDIWDFLPNQNTDKEPFLDITSGITTLPLILALKDNSLNNEVQNHFLKKNTNKIIEIIHTNGFLDKSRNIAQQFVLKAINELKKVNSSEDFLAPFAAFGNYIINRTIL